MLGAVCLEARVTGERGGAGNSRINLDVIRLSSDFFGDGCRQNWVGI